MKSLFIADITIVHLPLQLQEKKSITMNPFFGAALGNRNVCFTLTEKPKLRVLVGWFVGFFSHVHLWWMQIFKSLGLTLRCYY